MNILLLVLLPLVSGSTVWLTVEVAPKTEECFFTPITSLGPLVVEYMVMDSKGELGQFGELDINFRVTAPLVKKEGGSVASVLHSENKQAEGRHVFHPETIGDYKTCFDNKFSYLNTKTDYFCIKTEEVEEECVVKNFHLELEEQEYFLYWILFSRIFAIIGLCVFVIWIWRFGRACWNRRFQNPGI